VLPVGVHSTPLFSHPEDPDQVAHEGISWTQEYQIKFPLK